jgi:alpha-glucosidase (family GH31 glycosyl hydrolase)
VWYAWDRREKCARFWWESLKERDHSEDQGMDGIRMDLGETGCRGVKWIQLAQHRDRWQALVNVVMNLRVLVPWS